MTQPKERTNQARSYYHCQELAAIQGQKDCWLRPPQLHDLRSLLVGCRRLRYCTVLTSEIERKRTGSSDGERPIFSEAFCRPDRGGELRQRDRDLQVRKDQARQAQ